MFQIRGNRVAAGHQSQRCRSESFVGFPSSDFRLILVFPSSSDLRARSRGCAKRQRQGKMNRKSELGSRKSDKSGAPLRRCNLRMQRARSAGPPSPPYPFVGADDIPRPGDERSEEAWLSSLWPAPPEAETSQLSDFGFTFSSTSTFVGWLSRNLHGLRVGPMT